MPANRGHHIDELARLGEPEFAILGCVPTESPDRCVFISERALSRIKTTRLKASARSTCRSSAAAASARYALPVLSARWNWAYRWPCDVTGAASSSGRRGGRREGDSPIVSCVAVDRESPLVTVAGLEW
jgi:hypothetical protein